MAVTREFREFIARGNVIDLAVGVIIGAAFGKIVTTLVEGIIMPPIGLLLGNADFSQLYFNLGSTKYASLAEAQAAGAPTLRYGMFLNNVIDFVIVAFVIFLMIRQLSKLQKKKPAPAP
jgi:large conductance mechanosensitive channel